MLEQRPRRRSALAKQRCVDATNQAKLGRNGVLPTTEYEFIDETVGPSNVRPPVRSRQRAVRGRRRKVAIGRNAIIVDGSPSPSGTCLPMGSPHASGDVERDPSASPCTSS